MYPSSTASEMPPTSDATTGSRADGPSSTVIGKLSDRELKVNTGGAEELRHVAAVPEEVDPILQAEVRRQPPRDGQLDRPRPGAAENRGGAAGPAHTAASYGPWAASKRVTEMMTGGSRSADAGTFVVDVRDAVVNRLPRGRRRPMLARRPTASSSWDTVTIVPGRCANRRSSVVQSWPDGSARLFREGPAVWRVRGGHSERPGRQPPEHPCFRGVGRHHTRVECRQLLSQGEVRAQVVKRSYRSLKPWERRRREVRGPSSETNGPRPPTTTSTSWPSPCSDSARCSTCKLAPR